MTNVVFYKKDDDFVGFEVCGHSFFSESGTDIVCAALSSAVQLCVNLITEIMKLDCSLQVDEEKALISLELKDFSEIERFNLVANGLLLQIKLLKEEHKDYISLKIRRC